MKKTLKANMAKLIDMKRNLDFILGHLIINKWYKILSHISSLELDKIFIKWIHKFIFTSVIHNLILNLPYLYHIVLKFIFKLYIF